MPTISHRASCKMVGTLCFAHPTGSPLANAAPCPRRRRLREIRIRQTCRRTPLRACPALGERGENAVHPFALQLAEDVQADRRIAPIGLGARGTGDQERSEQGNDDSRLVHDKLEIRETFQSNQPSTSCRSSQSFASARFARPHAPRHAGGTRGSIRDGTAWPFRAATSIGRFQSSA